LLTALIRQRYAGLWIDAVDVSAQMLAQARARMGFDKRIRWLVTDLRHIPAKRSYPLIVSSSVLHWVDPLEEGLAQLANLLKPGGWLVFSLMIRGTLGELRESRLRVAPHKTPLGNLPTLRQVRQGLRYAGLEIDDERKEIRHVTYPSAAAFLRYIHDLGLTGGAVSAARVPLTRKELKNLTDDYQANFASDAGVKASYHIAYFKLLRRK
jgi:malonyl-CoA O-methyltransferase